MTTHASFTVDVPEDFTMRFASLFVPARGPMDSMPAKYTCLFPAKQLPDEWRDRLGVHTPIGWRPAERAREGVEYIGASSRIQPLILPKEASSQDLIEWECLLHLCDVMAMPRDWIFRERALKLLVQPFDFARYEFKTWGTVLNLRAVQVMDLEEGFLRREIRRRLDEMQDQQEGDD